MQNNQLYIIRLKRNFSNGVHLESLIANDYGDLPKISWFFNGYFGIILNIYCISNNTNQ